MLLVRTSKGISQPGQAYKMGILEKIVNGLKFILRLIWWTLRVYLSGHLIRVIQQISALKQLFVSYTWVMTHWILSFPIYFFSRSVLSRYFRNPVSMGLRANTKTQKWQKSKTCVRNETYKRLLWMADPISYSMAWSDRSPKFICLCINFSHYLNQWISDPFFQTNSP